MIRPCTLTAILNAAWPLLAKRTDPVISIYTITAALVSGVYFPPKILPGPLRALSYLVPDTYVIATIRHLLLPGGDTIPAPTTGAAILGLLLLNAALYPLAIWLFGRSLEYGRRTGTLGGY